MLWLDIYQKEKLVDSQKLLHFFLCGGNKNSYKVEVTGKRENFCDEEGLQY